MNQRRVRIAEIIGVVIALGVTTIIWIPSVVTKLIPENLVWRNIVAQLIDWVFCLVLVGIVLIFEKRSLRSLGFKPLSIQNFFTGIGLGGFFMIGVVLWKFLLSPYLPDFNTSTPAEAGNGLPESFFLWYAPFALVTASICEEVIYRGYAMERLMNLTKNPFLTVGLTHVAFVLYHLKDGMSSVIMLSVLGLLFPLYYIRFRDLTMVIVAHGFIDLLAVVGHIVGIRGG